VRITRFVYQSGEPSAIGFESDRRFIRGTRFAISSSAIFNDKPALMVNRIINQVYTKNKYS